MRDAFGGTFMMYFIIIFVVLYVTFLSVALKYLQAYRVKNEIINYIEQYEGFNETVRDKLENETTGYLNKASYNAASAVTSQGSASSMSTTSPYCNSQYGYCVYMKYYDGKNAYYKVETYISLEFTNVLGLDPIKVKVSGETRLVNVAT
jgi:hypothetical protein